MTNETVKTYQQGSIQAQVILDRKAQAYRVDLSRLDAHNQATLFSLYFEEPSDAVVYARDFVTASK